MPSQLPVPSADPPPFARTDASPAPARPAGVATTAAIWALTRAPLLVLTFGWFNGDTGLYHDQGSRWLEGQRPYADYPVEYPPAAALLFTLLAQIARVIGEGRGAFRAVFIVACLACDAVVAWHITKASRTRGPAVAYAVVGLALYPIWLVRFDLFPSLCVLLAAVIVGRVGVSVRPLAIGAALGGGIALKLYPVLLFIPWSLDLADRLRSRLSSLRVTTKSALAAAPVATASVLGKLGFAAFAIVVLSFVPAWLAGAGAAVTSFLDYHRGRGLHIESSYAAGLATINLVVPGTAWHVASHHAHNLAGPAASGLLLLSRFVHPVAVLAAAWLAWRRRLPLVQTWAALLATAIASASVFSPQFLLWLFPLALFACATNWQPHDAFLPIAIAVLTTAIFPLTYPDLIAGRWFAVALLLLRNLLLVLFARHLLRPRVTQPQPITG
ncbi:MAG TPA: hypothetical protein VGF45_02680 [Polyangia bacterium]